MTYPGMAERLSAVGDRQPSNDQNLWMALGGVGVGERTFPRMICV